MNNEQSLVQEWEEAKALGSSMVDFAESRGMTVKQLDNRLYYARRKMKEAQDEPVQQVTDKTEGNTRHVTFVDPDVRTLEDLIEACQIDLDEWVCTGFETNKWPVGAKLKTGQMSWKDGVATGQLNYKGLVVVPLIQVKAKFVRKEPVKVHPTVHPVRIEVEPFIDDGGSEDTHRTLVIGDAQIGFRRNMRTGELIPLHDRRALGAALALAQQQHFDELVWVGDDVDATEWTTRFSRSPEFSHTTQPMIYEAGWWYAQFAAALPNAKKIKLWGNHEVRWYEAIFNHMPWAYQLDNFGGGPMNSLSHVLGLIDLGYEVFEGYPEAIYEQFPGVKYIHGKHARAVPGSTANSIVQETDDLLTVFGHIHRIEMASKTLQPSGKIVQAATFGCLCHTDGRVPPGRNPNWQKGCGVVEQLGLSNRPSIYALPISDGSLIYGGRVHQAATEAEYVKHLREGTGYQF